MSKRVFIESLLLTVGIVGWLAYFFIKPYQPSEVVSPISEQKTYPLNRYSIENLSRQTFPPSQIVLDTATATTAAYTTYIFHFMTEGKKVTGLANIPQDAPAGASPVIVQFRGYADRDTYVTGVGTSRSGQVFAEHGFITLAPDFLGYGGSASPSADAFENRFETYTTALTLLASVGTLTQADPDRVGIWGHSNGGHIALAIKEITGKAYPTTLWAPVSKPFPFSILFYTDEANDHGKALRKELAKFETDYDVNAFSITSYFDLITGPIQLHQGTADEAVPRAWSDFLAKTLKAKDIDVTYYTYPGADHNMLGSWNTVVSRDVNFFTKNL